ncbi:hypothetical protein BOTCAL_0387g00130 [Botryotinia calthae]|uniref:Cytochrome P450 n=1 Tax=Botryotinia calthae TaxID=38488 RepID=A0A4Y8CTK4_9HELO|nr:hypothetical protein BOTCAL_0387g00130 [Botryotinia calthae]
MDVITAYIYGTANGTNWTGHPNEAGDYLAAFLHAVEPWPFFASTEIQGLVSVLGWFGVDLIPRSVNSAFDTIHSFVLNLTTHTINNLKTDNAVGCSPTSNWTEIWQRLNPIPETERANLIASDMVDQLHAGHEASGIVLTYLMWELSKNPTPQNRLRNDLRSFSSPRNSELLDTVFMETMI